MAHITIPAGEPLVSYTPGGSSTGPFNVTFPIFSESDLNVVVNGVLLSSSDWTFTPTDTRTGGYQAGYITLDSATTYEVVIYRDTTRSRTSDYAAGPLDINTLNTDVDRTVARDQDLKLQIDRTLRGPASDPAMDALPDAATRANQYLIFDADGNPTLAAYGVTTTPVSSFMATVLDDTTAADARTTLGVTLTNLGVSAFAQTILDDADASAMRTTLGIDRAIAQIVSTTTGAVATGTTTIPLDDTIPQNTEGDQYMSLAITPKSATNILEIEIQAEFATSAAGHLITALFQDSTASAIAAMTHFNGTNNGTLSVRWIYRMTAGTTSATTFKLRAGMNNAGTTTFNGTASSRLFGGIMASSIVIRERRV